MIIFHFACATSFERYVKNQSKLPKSLLVGGQCLDGVMLCLKPFDFNDFSLKLTKYVKFRNSHF